MVEKLVDDIPQVRHRERCDWGEKQHPLARVPARRCTPLDDIPNA